MVVKKVYLVVGLFVGFAFSSLAFSAQFQPVYSFKNLGNHSDAAGNSYQKVQVKCNPDMRLRYIHQSAGAENWCVDGNSNECFDERIDAATRSCGLEQQVIASVQASVATPAPQTAEEFQAEVERKKLEEELLANEQKKIELRSRQLELRKRELELQALQEAN